MRYVVIVCASAIAITLYSPAIAATGNALAGGWNGTVTSGNLSSAPSTAPGRSTVTASTPLLSVEVSAGPLFNFGSGGGSGGNTGGAPTPEVNAILGLILAGGTMAFLRRRRTGKAKPGI